MSDHKDSVKVVFILDILMSDLLYAEGAAAREIIIDFPGCFDAILLENTV